MLIVYLGRVLGKEERDDVGEDEPRASQRGDENVKHVVKSHV